MGRCLRSVLARLGVIVAGFLAAASSATACAQNGWGYAALVGRIPSHGVAATLEAESRPAVESGHVAAWVGVGGRGLGAGGSDAWIQVGVAAFPGAATVSLYHEVKRPGAPARYTQVLADVPTGERHRVAVLEVAGRPGRWRAWVDGRPVSAPVHLPGSHGRWAGLVAAESRARADAETCNRFAFRFRDLEAAIRPGGRWRALTDATPFVDPGYAIVDRTPTGFTARTT